MSISKFLAFDFGAESGRAIVGILENERISLEEIHRFPNKQVRLFGHLHWDILYLFEELKKGLSLAVQKGHSDLESIGIDTWGVDFGLIGKDGEVLGFPFTYRDSRTNGMMEKVFEKISREEIYTLTGNQFMQINSLYQLYAMLMNNEETLEICDKLLFMPDLFNFFLTGKKCSEYTIASTSQLLNATKKEWDKNIFQKLGLPINIMAPVIQPGSIIDKLLSDIAIEVGLSKEVDVVSIGCHDTASAVAAVPAFTDKWAFISSGTWSVIGIELNQPLINKITMMSNFTNEGGIGGKIRFLQNVIGLWLLQECRKSWEKNSNRLTYDELIKMASKVQEFKSIINPDDNLFLNPPDMLSAIKNYCIKTRQPVPESIGEYVRCIFESLALKYKGVIKKIDSVTKSTIETIHIVGGGSQNEMLNQLTANACGLPVAAGPVEATALGNIIAQALAKGTIQSIQYGKELIARSFPIKMYKPSISKKWDEQFQKIYPFK